MNKTTKNILTEDTIAMDLSALNKEERAEYPLLIAAMFVFTLIPSIVAIAAIKSVMICILVVLLFSLPFIISIVCFLKLFYEPRKIMCGKFEVTVQELGRKRELGGKQTTWILYFRGFRIKSVSYYDYHYASEGDKYYLVYYKNSKSIRLFYPLRTHSIKESPSFKVK